MFLINKVEVWFLMISFGRYMGLFLLYFFGGSSYNFFFLLDLKERDIDLFFIGRSVNIFVVMFLNIYSECLVFCCLVY